MEYQIKQSAQMGDYGNDVTLKEVLPNLPWPKIKTYHPCQTPLLAQSPLLRSQPARSVPASNRDGQQARIRILHRSCLVRTVGRRHVVVRKRVTESVQIGGVHDARVVVRDRVLIVLARRSGRLDGVDQQGGTVKGGAEAGDQGV